MSSDEGATQHAVRVDEVRNRFVYYRFSGGMFLISVANCVWATGSIGLCLTLVLAGSLPRKLSFFQFVDGLIGRGTKPPPQFGQTLPNTASTHAAQNVHSYAQMRASSELGGRALLQCSQVGLSSSMEFPLPLPRSRHLYALIEGLLDCLQRLAHFLQLGAQKIKMQVALRLILLEFPQPFEDSGQLIFVRHGKVVGWRLGLRVRHTAE
jgi:hypothetical protein